ncbi:integral membrane family protein [Rhizoctonia solani]|uniref:Integral membrane family protein n=1 Tax=Rhizoctonia solani TaxID=456999 RepID=A0A8H8P553_9AGAM|nr:integral membrane family protein [Rhizoctonia solani]QRW25714.1 integral membrane family protein [Rhizoctonia solani]
MIQREDSSCQRHSGAGLTPVIQTRDLGNIFGQPSDKVMGGGCIGDAGESTMERRSIQRHGLIQLLNPLEYTILVLPASIARWMYISRPNPPSVLDSNMGQFATATLVFHSSFRLSGFINVVLILATRSGLLLINSTGELYPSDPRRVEEERNQDEIEQQGLGQSHSSTHSAKST